MSSRSLLALTLIVTAAVNIQAADLTANLNWSSRKIQITVQRQNSDAAIPTGISVRKSTNEIAVVGDDHLVRIKNRDSGELIRIFESHSDWVKIAKFHPNGKTLFTAGSDRKIIVWNADNHHDYHRFATETRAISDLEIDDTGRYLVTVGFDSKLNVYDIDTEKKIFSLACPSRDMRTVAINSNHLVATGGRNGVIRVFDLATGKKVTDIHAHQKRIRDLIFTDDSTIVSCSDDRSVRISDVATKTSKELIKVPAKLHSITSLGNGQIAIGASDNIIRLASVTQEKEVGYLSGHVGTVCSLQADGNELISGSFDTQIRVWTIDDSFVQNASRIKLSKVASHQPAAKEVDSKPTITPAPQAPVSRFAPSPVLSSPIPSSPATPNKSSSFSVLDGSSFSAPSKTSNSSFSPASSSFSGGGFSVPKK